MSRTMINEHQKTDKVWNNPKLLKTFSELDDIDIMASFKAWENHEDKTLSKLCKMIINRNLYKIKLQDKRFTKTEIEAVANKIKTKYKLTDKEVNYFVFQDSIINNAYNPKMDKINILLKNGKMMDIVDAADTLNIQSLSTPVKKWFMCFPKH